MFLGGGTKQKHLNETLLHYFDIPDKIILCTYVLCNMQGHQGIVVEIKYFVIFLSGSTPYSVHYSVLNGPGQNRFK